MKLMKIIPFGKVIIIAFSAGESSAYMLKLILDKYRNTHKIIVCFCNTGEEDEQSLIFAKKIEEYFRVEVVWLEYRKIRGFEIVDFKTAYRKTNQEIKNGYKNHPFRFWIEDYGLPAYPLRTCTREMKERTISRYLSSIGIMPRMCVRCVGIRFDEISIRTPSSDKYYELILQGITKKDVNRFFIEEMPFRLDLESYLGNCGACISKGLRNLCTIARKRKEKFEFFRFISTELGFMNHQFYRERKSISDIFEMSLNENIKDAQDNRFNLEDQIKLDFDFELDSEGACGGTCEAFS